MDKSIEFKLLKAVRTQDELLQWSEQYLHRTVYGQKTSVTANEFFAAGEHGHSPEFRVIMFGPDYCGEELLEYCGEKFTIYRVYWAKNDMVELYAERRRGDEDHNG